jgi:hypothetical protein
MIRPPFRFIDNNARTAVARNPAFGSAEKLYRFHLLSRQRHDDVAFDMYIPRYSIEAAELNSSFELWHSSIQFNSPHPASDASPGGSILFRYRS